MKVSFEVTVLFVMSRKFQLVEAGGRSGEVAHHVNTQLVSGSTFHPIQNCNSSPRMLVDAFKKEKKSIFI